MDKKDLKTKFENYLNNSEENQRNLELTINTFTNDVFDMFLNGLEAYRNRFDKSYKKVFLYAVIPLMREKLDIFGNHNFENETYKRYESLFISFMNFANENKEYINDIMFDGRKEKLENLVKGQYGKNFGKKDFLEAWHDHINKDTGKNGDKHRKYLSDIYGYLSNEQLKSLYNLFFDSYIICSKINSKNNEHKGEENYEKKDAFGNAYFNLESHILGCKKEKLSEIKSLFGKYLNFIPKYRETIFDNMNGKPEQGEAIQKNTESSLLSNLGEEENITKKWAIPGDYSYEGDGFGPTEIVYTNKYYKVSGRGDVLPLDDGIFPDPTPFSEGEIEEIPNNESEGIDKKSEKPAQDIIIHFDDEEKEEEKEEEGENPDYTGDYTDSYKNR